MVVEGPSAAGKTSWVERHAGAAAVPEPPRPEPAPDPDERAPVWAAANAARWQQALAVEARLDHAVCDTDPFKLHYAWGLWRLGAAAAAAEAFLSEAAASRAEFAAGRLGLADVVLCAIPAADELAAQRAGDATRARRRFALHSRLGEPLREWYQAVDALDPGRVLWEHPSGGLDAVAGIAPRSARTGADLFDAFLARLPARP